MLKNTVNGIRSVNVIRNNSNHTSVFHESNLKRDSNVSSSTEILTSGLSVNDLENVSAFALSQKASNNKYLAVNRGSQILNHSTFLRSNVKNNTYCPKTRDSIVSLHLIKESEERRKIHIPSLSINKFPENNNSKEERANTVKDLLKRNILREYEQRIKYFMRNEKFFLNETNNLKINIPFAYFVRPPILVQRENTIQKKKDGNGYGGSLTDRIERPKSIHKDFSICFFLFFPKILNFLCLDQKNTSPVRIKKKSLHVGQSKPK